MQLQFFILPTLISACLLSTINFCYAISEEFFANGREIIINDAVKRIKREGYAVELHTVQTLDGYIITMHRIPYSGGGRRPVVFLMTGLYSTTDAWLLNDGDSLPYLLSNNGYDVWIGNNRGTVYGRKNVMYSRDDREFWNFSFHEMGVYDLPAMVDYVLQQTGQKTMHYCGVSQGATIFLVMNAMLPQYNARFESAHLLCPVAFVDHKKGPLVKVLAPLLGTRNYLTERLKTSEVKISRAFIKRLNIGACVYGEYPLSFCVNELWEALGYDTKYLNKTLLPDIAANSPAGGSVKQLIHQLQSYNSGNFGQYNYGSEKNKILYNQTVPPNYQLERVTVPTFIYFAVNDYVVSVGDIQRLVRILPNVHAVYKMPLERWNHLDFVCGLGVKEYIFDKVVDDINAYTY